MRILKFVAHAWEDYTFTVALIDGKPRSGVLVREARRRGSMRRSSG
jgi:hypothetical protein